MFLVIFGLAVTFAFFFYLKWENSSYVRTIDLIPGPPKVPLFGNALSIPLDTHGKNRIDPFSVAAVYYLLS
ncbi:Uncharacterized protein APZ42_005484 [Daphnia magna]|uniref:Uncharacterized protein n=1 Tax=Daphnia magna TaxID=35525 RepID=A0A164GF54_9CRUS|nr:Uncharacterized protein APZ42_005484 [Daphnia magna]